MGKKPENTPPPKENEEIEEIEEIEEVENEPEEPKDPPKPKAAKKKEPFNPMANVPDPDAGKALDEVKSSISNLEKKIEGFFAAKPEPKEPKKEKPREKSEKGHRWFDEFELFPEN